MAIKDIEYVKEMRNNGMKYDEIAKKLGVTKQQAWYIGKQAGITNTHIMMNEKVVYKGVKNWLSRNEMLLHDFCLKCGEKCGANSRTHKFLIGKHNGDMIIIKNIMNVCGLTFEEAFGEVTNERKEENYD